MNLVISNIVGTVEIAYKDWKIHKLDTANSWITLEYGFLKEVKVVRDFCDVLDFLGYCWDFSGFYSGFPEKLMGFFRVRRHQFKESFKRV